MKQASTKIDRIEIKSMFLILPGTGRGTSRRLVEGVPRPLKNNLSRSGRVQQNLRGGNAYDLQSPFAQEPFATQIADDGVGAVVPKTIDFDDKPGLAAVEIDHITLDRMLPTKLEAARAFPRLLPEQHLREAHLLSQPPGDIYGWALARRPAPSTALRAVPLPVPGRILGNPHHTSPSRVSSRRSRRA